MYLPERVLLSFAEVYWESAENWKSVLRELNGTGWTHR
jgi:hypothetical protein